MNEWERRQKRNTFCATNIPNGVSISSTNKSRRRHRSRLTRMCTNKITMCNTSDYVSFRMCTLTHSAHIRLGWPVKLLRSPKYLILWRFSSHSWCAACNVFLLLLLFIFLIRIYSFSIRFINIFVAACFSFLVPFLFRFICFVSTPFRFLLSM